MAKKRLISIFLLLAASAALFAGGAKAKAGTPLAQADQMIAEKKYNAALAFLSDYAQKNPDDFSEAQKRIRKISAVRNEYNGTAELLLDEMEKPEPSNETILALTNKLMELDPERISETQDFITSLRDIALFRTNRSRLEKILAQAQAEIDAGDYARAMATYAGGLDIYQAEFFQLGLGYEVESEVRADIDGMSGGVGTFASLAGPLESAVGGLEALKSASPGAQDFAAWNAAYGRLGQYLDEYMRLRAVYARADSYFARELSIIRAADPTTGDRSFLSFALRLLEGVADREGDGFLGVLDAVWNSAAGRAEAMVAQKSDALFGEIHSLAMAGDFAAMSQRLDLLPGYAALPENIIERWGGYSPETPHETLFDVSVPQEKAGLYAEYRAETEAVARYRNISALGLRMQGVQTADTVAAWQSGGSAAALIAQEQAVQQNLAQLRDQASALVEVVDGDIANYQSFQNSFGYEADLLMPFSRAREAALHLQALIDEKEGASFVRSFTIANGQVESRLSARQQDLARAAEQVAGGSSNHPAQAASALAALDQAAAADLETADALLAQYAAADQNLFAGNPQLSALRAGAQEARSGLQSVRTQGQSSAAQARSLVAQAQSLRQDGDRLATEARSALAQENFDRAQERLVTAATRYDESLAIEDDPQLRQIRNTVLPQLDADIARLKNDAVVRDVGQLLVSARQDYNRGDFDVAEEKLTRAQNLWHTTQTEDNQDIENWLNIIHSALSSRSGRTIPATAPLYAEMSQLLSDARRNYDEGVSYYGQNRRTDGKARFDSAKENTQKVKLMYPLNETAGLLELQMERETDPQSFAANFNERVQAAISGCARRDWQAYAELQNLFTLYPNYPNRAAIINRAEIDMGIRPPPPDPAKVAAARNLAAQARAVVNASPDNEIELRRAQALVNQALQNDPNNEDAAQLLNRIATLLSTGGALFDQNTETKYRRALELLQQNRGIEAYQVANEILADARYKNNSRLLDLLQRIRSVVGAN